MQICLSPSMRSITISSSNGFFDFMKLKIAALVWSFQTIFHTMLVLAALLPFAFIITTVVMLKDVNTDMKSYIWLQTVDGSIQQVEEEVAMSCPMICQEVLQTGMRSSKNYDISLPKRVNLAFLGLILDYCRFHQVPGRSNKERKSFDEKFIRMDVDQLCELASAADSLQLRPLFDITSRALARIIEGKTPEEIRSTLHLPDDLTENDEEVVRTVDDDVFIDKTGVDPSNRYGSDNEADFARNAP